MQAITQMTEELEDYIESLTFEINQLEDFDRSCCDQAELEVLRNVLHKIQKIKGLAND